MQPFFESASLKFSCTRCGRCCATRGGYYVYLQAGEAERIRRHLGLSVDWFRRRYLARTPDGERVLADGAGARCIFLGDDGLCRVYPVRPSQCRTYPFWPELVNRRRDWRREAARCEGIGRGRAVARSRIRRALSACED